MVLLDTRTPGNSREIYSDDADCETLATEFTTEGLRVQVSPSASSLYISLLLPGVPVSSRTTVLRLLYTLC